MLDMRALLVLAPEPPFLAQVLRQAARAGLQAEFQLADDLRVVGDRLLRLGGERHPHRGHVHQDRERRHRQRALRLLQAVGLPVQLRHGAGDGAALLLVEQRHPVGEAQQARRLVGPEGERLLQRLFVRGGLVDTAVRVHRQRGAAGPSPGQPDLHLERIAAVHGGRA